MKIQMLITELRTGGAERSFTELALGLRERGDQVSVMSLMPLPRDDRVELVDRLREAQIPVETTNSRGGWSLPGTLRAVKKWLAKGQPDCLQTFLFHANVIGAFANRRVRVPVHVGGVRVADPALARNVMETLAGRRMRGIVCVSESVEKFVRQHWSPSASVRLTTIRNGVRGERFRDIEPFPWERHGLSPGGRVILFLGRLHRQKGLDLLLDVAPTLLRLHPDWRLAIVGEGPLKNSVKRMLSRTGAGQAVLLPWQTDVASLYAGAELVVMPSRYEGMPNVVLESMASGKCVAAAEVEGVTELLGDATAEQTFPPGDRGSLVQRLDALLRRDDLSILGQQNQRRANEHFSIDVMVERYRELYQELLETHARH
jgi:starch synthase (maltosyl-transferring)